METQTFNYSGTRYQIHTDEANKTRFLTFKDGDGLSTEIKVVSVNVDFFHSMVILKYDKTKYSPSNEKVYEEKMALKMNDNKKGSFYNDLLYNKSNLSVFDLTLVAIDFLMYNMIGQFCYNDKMEFIPPLSFTHYFEGNDVFIKATGGGGDYYYSINDSGWQKENSFPRLAYGSYKISVKSAILPDNIISKEITHVKPE